MNKSFFYIFFVMQILIILFYGVFVKFSFSTELNVQTVTDEVLTTSRTEVIKFYPSYQDIHVMIFVGFGFLMSFLRKHSWSSIGFNFMSAVVALQVYPLLWGFWERVLGHHHWEDRIEVNLERMIYADFAAGAVLITLGALLGKSNLHEFLVISVIQVIGYSLNQTLAFQNLMALDTGGSMVIHSFGAVFGITYGILNRPRDKNRNIILSHPDAEGSYATNTHALIGTLFLFLFWPSFNSAPSTVHLGQSRSVICTILSLTGSCIATFLFSFCLRGGKFNIEDILNATIAGGVIIGTACELMVDPFSAILVGAVAGVISTMGFAKWGPYVNKRLGLYDSCGVSWLHAIPGVLGGIFGSIFIATWTEERLGFSPNSILPKLRSPHDQASIQIACTFMSVGIAIGSALVAHLIIKIFSNSIGILQYKELYHDQAHYFAGDFHGDWHGEHKHEEAQEDGYNSPRVDEQPQMINNDAGQTQYYMNVRPQSAFQQYWNIEIV